MKSTMRQPEFRKRRTEFRKRQTAFRKRQTEFRKRLSSAVAHPIHVSNSHTKFGWISSNGLGGDSVTDGRTYCEHIMALVVYFSILFFDIELPEEVKGHNSVDIYYNTQQHHGQYKLKYINDHCQWAWTQENLSSEVCEQQWRRPACTSAQSDQPLCYSLIGTC